MKPVKFFGGPEGGLMSQTAMDDEGHDFHVPVRVSSLDQTWIRSADLKTECPKICTRDRQTFFQKVVLCDV